MSGWFHTAVSGELSSALATSGTSRESVTDTEVLILTEPALC